eukprot:6194233-Pleurochrysis_carterae.AAC.3
MHHELSLVRNFRQSVEKTKAQSHWTLVCDQLGLGQPPQFHESSVYVFLCACIELRPELLHEPALSRQHLDVVGRGAVRHLAVLNRHRLREKRREAHAVVGMRATRVPVRTRERTCADERISARSPPDSRALVCLCVCVLVCLFVGAAPCVAL